MTITYDFGNGDFEYEIDQRDLRQALIELIQEDTKFTTDQAIIVYEDLLYTTDLVEDYAERSEDWLKDYFEDYAKEEYEEYLEEKDDREDWYGTKRDVLGIY